MKRDFSLGMLAVFVCLSGCGEGRPDLRKVSPNAPLPNGVENARPEAPKPAPGKPLPSPATSGPGTPPAAFACANPISALSGSVKSSLASGLLENGASLARPGWTVDNVQLFVESSDHSEQLTARAFRSQQVVVECQNTRPGSTLAGYAAFPDSVAPVTGQYPGQLEVTLGLNVNGIANGQAVLAVPVLRGMPVYRKIQDWKPVGATESIRGVNGASLKQRVLKVEAALIRPGYTVLQTESEVETARGKYRVTTRAEYSL
jgi:hypothetical protein